MPLGYEYGFRKRLNVTDMNPSDWEEPLWDISDEISQINEFKSKFKCLNEDGEIKQIRYENLGILIIRKTSLDKKESILLIYNKDWHNLKYVFIKELKWCFPSSSPIFQLELGGSKTEYIDIAFERTFQPNEYIFFYQHDV